MHAGWPLPSPKASPACQPLTSSALPHSPARCPTPPAPQAKDYKYVGLQKANGGIVIRDVEAEAAAAAAKGKGKGKAAVGGEEDRQMEADEEFARQLQAKMDAETRAKWAGLTGC